MKNTKVTINDAEDTINLTYLVCIFKKQVLLKQ